MARTLCRRIKNALVLHFTDTHHHRTEEQLETEMWLAPGMVPFSRFFLMPAGILIQACSGSVYAWSGFNLPIEEAVYGNNKGVDRGVAVNVFYVAIAMLGISGAVMGPWMERKGPKAAALLGSVLFYLGNLLTALGIYTKAMPLVFIGYGFIGGIGVGLSYITPVSPLQKWFPEIRGVAAGLAVCGFGAGSIVAPYTQKALLSMTFGEASEENHSVELTFVILGSCYFVIMTTCALVLRVPPPGYEVKGVTVDTIKGAERKQIGSDGQTNSLDLTTLFAMNLVGSIRSPQYWMTYIMFLGNILPGLMIISKVQSVIKNQLKRPEEAANVNSILACVNLIGRLTLPLLSDLLHSRRIFYAISLLCQLICLGFLPIALEAGNYGAVLACVFIIAYFYGAGFGMIPAFLADQFGARNVGATHGLMLTAWSLAGVAGGLIFSAVYSLESKIRPSMLQWYSVNFQWMLGPVFLAFVISLFIPCDLSAKKLPKVPGETLRVKFLCLPVVRFIGWRPQIVSSEKLATEWNTFLSTLDTRQTGFSTGGERSADHQMQKM